MARPEYEYYGLMAETWDLFRGDTSGWEDRMFYLELIHKSGEPVLDVGCGTGRLLLDFMSQGLDIDGVDLSPEMLELCRKKAQAQSLQPTLYEDDMVTMDLPRHYRTIIVPSSSFQLIVDDRQERAAMSNLYSHLLPGGTLAMPFMNLQNQTRSNNWQKTGEIIRPRDGALVRRWSQSWYDPSTQLEHTEDRYEVFRDGKKISEESHSRSPATRSYTQQQAAEMYSLAGFEDIRAYKGFSFEPASSDDDIFTMTGEKG